MSNKTILLSKNPLSLEFANQFSGKNLFEYYDLINWSQKKGAITLECAERLKKEANTFPSKTNPIVSEAKVLANSLYRIFNSIAKGNEPSMEDIDFLNGSIAHAFSNLKLTTGPSFNYQWGWLEKEKPSPDQPLWRVLLDAGEVLVKARKDRLRLCINDDCGKLFLDTSKGGRRKWCSMETCGNRSKTKRYRNKTK